MRRLLFVALPLTIYAAPAQAYIDPGTGSALLYVVAVLVVSAFFVIRGLSYRVAELVFRAGTARHRCNVALHVEDPRYEITFLPVVRELAARGIDVTYFTMYERGDVFPPLPGGVAHVQIKPGLVGYAFLNNVEAKILVTTTPQLDVMTFRRSRRVRHYCHIPHALGESVFVRPYAYDFFDSVLCCGEILKRNIRRIEFIRKLPAKRLFETGIPHYDVLIERAKEPSVVRERPTVLVAPSWGPMSIFERCGTEFLLNLAERYRVIVRPHPQMRVSQPAIYERILTLQEVVVDTHETPAEAMATADVLVSDISGIMHEFAFIHRKPVVIVDHGPCAAGLEGTLFGGVSELKERCRDFIISISPEQVPHLAAHVDSALARHSEQRIEKVRDELVYNFGAAGTVAAQQIEEILGCL